MLMVLPLAGVQLTAGDGAKSDSELNPDKVDTVKKGYPGPDEFVKVDEVPVALKLAQAVYPDSLKKADVEGVVWVKSLVDTTGMVRDVVIWKSSGHKEFDDVAKAAALKSLFKPAMQDGKPVAVWIAYKIEFEIGDPQIKEKKEE
jgi:TonB family protein